MITFDVLTLKAFKEEQEEFLTGARFSKIQQPTRREFIFSLRNLGETRQLYVNINPQFYHLCFMDKANSKKRVLEIPQKPPMFCMLLRKYLESSKIAKVNQPKNERILEFYIETYNEIGEKIYLCLAFEFMGKHSNVILYNYDTNMIVGCAHNVGAEKSREREIFGGLPYVYPPKQNKMDIQDYSGEIEFENLANNFHMFSNSFAKSCVGKSLPDLKRFISLENISPVISEDYSEYSLFSELLNGNRCASVNEMIDNYYAHYIALDKFRALQQQYKTIISTKHKKLVKSLKQMEYKLLSDSDSDKYRLWGDLIMANMYALKDYSSEIEVFDYENEKQIKIELDETKTLKDNANHFYKLYNKAKTARLKLSELVEESNVNRLYYEQILYSINSAQNIDDLFELTSEVEVLNEKISKKSDSKISEIMQIDLGSGNRIYIGKNNKQNDYIISKIASDEDLWFHVHNCAGSHVLLKSNEINDDLILKCARLAKEYSSVKNSSKIGVIYTKRKYIRKPPAAVLGYVTYKNEKEIVLD